jgi:hypothetical protein
MFFLSYDTSPMEIALADNNANKTAANSQFRKLRQAEDGKRAMLDYENSAAAMRAKTARLRELRLAREAEEAAAAAAAPPAPVKKKAAKKKAPVAD